ncbi:MAG: hypothetical protein PQJ58_13700 [Spirochaetales bacterium]|nr:hypothetical protein [Spirochaetales bacterium]
MIFLCLLLILCAPLGALDLYISDSLGSQISSAGSLADAQWIISIETLDDAEERILYKDQVLYKRWSLSKQILEGSVLYTEQYYFGDSLRTESVTNENDRLEEERLYDSKGSLIVHNRYIYEADKLVRIERDSETDTPDYQLMYRDNGSLVYMQSDGSDRIEWRSGDFRKRYLDTLYLVEGNVSSFMNYENGRLSSKTVKNGDTIIEERMIAYSEGGIVSEEVINEIDKDRRTERFYNNQGDLLVENRYSGDELEFSQINTYQDGFLIRKQERSSSVRDLWFYEYCGSSDPDAQPCKTSWYRNGNLLKITERLENRTEETLYRNNKAVITNVIETDQGVDS